MIAMTCRVAKKDGERMGTGVVGIVVPLSNIVVMMIGFGLTWALGRPHLHLKHKPRYTRLLARH